LGKFTVPLDYQQCEPGEACIFRCRTSKSHIRPFGQSRRGCLVGKRLQCRNDREDFGTRAHNRISFCFADFFVSKNSFTRTYDHACKSAGVSTGSSIRPSLRSFETKTGLSGSSAQRSSATPFMKSMFMIAVKPLQATSLSKSFSFTLLLCYGFRTLTSRTVTTIFLVVRGYLGPISRKPSAAISSIWASRVLVAF